MSDRVEIVPLNFQELQRALRVAPDLTFKFVRERLRRFNNTFRNRFIRRRMRGRPGINWDEGKKRVGGNVRTEIKGRDLAEIRAEIRLSRLLSIHEHGGVIVPKRGAWLFLRRKGRRGEIFARVKSVTIPARLGFEAFFRQEAPKEGPRLAKAAQRAIRQALRERMRDIKAVTQRLAI